MPFNDPPWVPVKDPQVLARLGKLQEELSELQKVVARIIIQGINESDPADGKRNIDALGEEVTDVVCCIDLLKDHWNIGSFINYARWKRKRDGLLEWFKQLEDNPHG